MVPRYWTYTDPISGVSATSARRWHAWLRFEVKLFAQCWREARAERRGTWRRVIREDENR